MSIDPDGLKAPYQQLADILRERISSGDIPPGRRIPSHAELEQEFPLSRNTIKKALDLLKDEGLIVTAPGRGLFVAEGLRVEIRSDSWYGWGTTFVGVWRAEAYPAGDEDA